MTLDRYLACVTLVGLCGSYCVEVGFWKRAVSAGTSVGVGSRRCRRGVVMDGEGSGGMACSSIGGESYLRGVVWDKRMDECKD